MGPGDKPLAARGARSGRSVDRDELAIEAEVAGLLEREGGAHGSALERPSWLGRLREALSDGGFTLVAQPLSGICSDGLPRYELLLRLREANGDLVAAEAFVEAAERFDLIQQIDRWVFTRAVELLAGHAAAGWDISLSVNMSGKTLVDPTILEHLTAVLAATPIPPDRLVIEVTETAAIVNIDRAREVARALRELGCRFALDDFGAGFASFLYLKHLEFDFLKIDGEFIKALPGNATDELVVRAMVQVARGFGVKTIAEFVGDEETVHSLRRLGVDYGQGYHLGHPQPVDELLALVAGR